MAPANERAIVTALCQGDGEAFARLVDELHPVFVRHARLYLPDTIAEEVVQDTWESVVNNIGSFAGRSTLKTWIFRILLNAIRTRGAREARIVPFTALGSEGGEHSPSVDLSRLVHGELGAGYWPAAPPRWDAEPEAHALQDETRAVIARAIEGLPPAQREVMTLRDIDGWAADEVCEALGISEVNGRVLLHRARAAVRRALEVYFVER